MSKLLTITVPYIPPFDKDVMPPSYFQGRIKDFKGIDAEFKDYFLHTIEGTRLVYYPETDEWIDVGHNAIYHLKSGDSSPKSRKET